MSVPDRIIRLVVRGDDFGMCHAINEGIQRACTEGIVTTASTMAPCPWFGEAVKITKEIGIPLGAHQTLTCEWDYFRWRPLTDGPSLAGADGTFRPSVELARQRVQYSEVVRELVAQVDRFSSAGSASITSTITWVLCFLRDAEGKKAWLLDYLRGLVPGTHLLVCHPGVASSELDSLTGPDSVLYRWAAEYRLADLDVLTDPQVRDLIGELGIRLCSLQEALSGG